MTTAAAQESPKPMVRDWAMTAHARLFLMLVGITIAIRYWRSI